MVHLDPNRREEAIEAGWRAYASRLAGFEKVYRETVAAWDVIAVVADRVIGALFVKDGVIHLGIEPAWHGRWASRRLIREMLAYGTRTTVLEGEHQCRKFVRRIGFVERNGAYEHEGAVCRS